MPQKPSYTGDPQYQPQQRILDPQGRCYDPYEPETELIDVVNLAIDLERPLLLEGEPGSGKTGLASAIVYEFTQRYKEELGGQWWPYYIWNIKSTTRAKEGLYSFDAVARLRDAQLISFDAKVRQYRSFGQDMKDPKQYRSFGPLGEALRPKDKESEQWQTNIRPVVLIDEVDKAERGFVNDLLQELDKFSFEIPETGESFSCQNKPIILITSNQEKPLSDAFLRRCLYFYMDFPDSKRLDRIITRRLEAEGITLNSDLIQKGLDYFIKIRDNLQENSGSKLPGTSELIDYLKAVSSHTKKATDSNVDDILHKKSILSTVLKTYSDLSTVLKTYSDLSRIQCIEEV